MPENESTAVSEKGAARRAMLVRCKEVTKLRIGEQVPRNVFNAYSAIYHVLSHESKPEGDALALLFLQPGETADAWLARRFVETRLDAKTASAVFDVYHWARDLAGIKPDIHRPIAEERGN